MARGRPCDVIISIKNKITTYVNIHHQTTISSSFTSQATFSACFGAVTTAIEAPPVKPFFAFEDKKGNIGNEFWCGGLFEFQITVSLRGKGRMDRQAFQFLIIVSMCSKKNYGSHECFLLFQCFIWRTQKLKHDRRTQIPLRLSDNW